jgi:glutaredoxin-like protein NrdH
MKTVLYTLPDCPQCNATKKYLDRDHVEYSTIDLSVDKEAYELVSSLGYKNAPVVISGDNHWSGFRPDKIASLKKIKEG